MKQFHVHIYFEAKDLEQANKLIGKARTNDLFEATKLHDRPVGPHPTGMIELLFFQSVYNEVVDWVEENRGSLSVLIHQDSGDDFKDHTEDILWLGPKQPLDFSFFELVKIRTDLRVHQ